MSFEFSNYKWGEDAIGTTSGEITWSMNLAGLMFDQISFSLAQFEAEVRAAFETWADVAQLDFTEVGSGGDMTLSVSGDSTTSPNQTNLFGEPSGTVGIAISSFGAGPVQNNGISIVVDGEVRFDIAENWVPNDDTSGTVNFYAVAVHEIGHLLGLDHVDDDTEIMNPIIRTNVLGDGDIAGIQFIYGARYGTDGFDDLDLSALLSGQTIQLAAGDDILIATDFADIILGGTGSDTVNGGGGNDRIVDTRGTNNLSGDAGNDTIIGGSGVLTAFGDTGNDIMIGGIGNDTLDGGADDDILRGDPLGSFLHGNDRLIAGTGTDILAGGGGADVFVFVRNGGANTIASFDIAGTSATITGADFEVGIDRIDLTDFGLTVAPTAIDSNNNAVLTLGSTTITLVGILASDLDAGDFILS